MENDENCVGPRPVSPERHPDHYGSKEDLPQRLNDPAWSIPCEVVVGNGLVKEETKASGSAHGRICGQHDEQISINHQMQDLCISKH